jgi:Zn-dependent alcohol dehydrogenase
MMNFMQESNFSFEQLIREKIPLHRAAEAFEMFESGMSGKFILLPN